MLNNFIYAKKKALFLKALNNNEVLDEAIVFIEDTKEIWNHGTYFDCSTISDLEAIRQGAAKGATALQSYTEQYKGTVTGVKINGNSKSPSNGVVDLGTVITSHQDISGKADKTEIPTKVSQLTNDSGFTSTKGTVTGVTINGNLYHPLPPNGGTVNLGTVITSHQDISGKQDKLVSGSNIKTINGESILGSGDITISSGGSSSGNGAYTEVNHGTSDTTFTLTPNTFHVWDEVSSLTLTIGAETSGVANEYLFQFTSGATATTLSLPSDLKWANDSAPTIEPNMIYQVSILKGLASVLEFSNAQNVVLITFYYLGLLYSAEKGMTWEQWCNSIYNSTLLKISGGMLMVNGIYPIYNSSGILVYGTDVIIENEYYDMPQSGGGA